MTRRQRAGGAVLAAVGALGVSASAYLYWFDGREATDIPVERLFQTDVSGTASSYWTSVAIALALVTVLGVVGAILQSRLVLVLGWLIGVATLALWVVMQAIDNVDDDLDFTANDAQAGAWACAVALLVMLIGIVAMGPRDRPVAADVPAETTTSADTSADASTGTDPGTVTDIDATDRPL